MASLLRGARKKNHCGGLESPDNWEKEQEETKLATKIICSTRGPSPKKENRPDGKAPGKEAGGAVIHHHYFVIASSPTTRLQIQEAIFCSQPPYQAIPCDHPTAAQSSPVQSMTFGETPMTSP